MCWIGNECQDFEGFVNWTTEVAELSTGDPAAVETEVTTGESIIIDGDFYNEENLVKNDEPVMVVFSSEDNTTEAMLTTEKDIISTVRPLPMETGPTETVTELGNIQSTTLDKDIELSEALPTAKQRSGDLEAWHKLRQQNILMQLFIVARLPVKVESLIHFVTLWCDKMKNK